MVGDSQADWGQLAAIFQRALKRRFLCKNFFVILSVELMSRSMFEDNGVSEYLGEPYVENMIKVFLQLKKRGDEICRNVLPAKSVE